MTTPNHDSMSVKELEALKQKIENELQSKKKQRIEEAFQKISHLDDDEKRSLVSRIQGFPSPSHEDSLMQSLRLMGMGKPNPVIMWMGAFCVGSVVIFLAIGAGVSAYNFVQHSQEQR